MSYAPDIIDSARAAYGHGRLASPDRTARMENPLCGDEIEIDLALHERRITDLAHRARGCTFTLASASVLATVVRGRGIDDVRALARSVKRDLAAGVPLAPEVGILAAVRMYPARLRCALLPWDALLDALHEA